MKKEPLETRAKEKKFKGFGARTGERNIKYCADVDHAPEKKEKHRHQATE